MRFLESGYRATRTKPRKGNSMRIFQLAKIRTKTPYLLTAILLSIAVTPCSRAIASPPCEIPNREIAVDANLDDWKGIKPHVMCDKTHLRFSQRARLDPKFWDGVDDLCFQWRAAWSGNRFFFAFEVTDDIVAKPTSGVSFECDCVEIYLDYNNQGGRRVKILDGRDDWFDKCDPREMMGYELHFLATEPTQVYLDHTDKYAVDKPHTERFKKDWAGEAKYRKTENGYILEMSFQIPDVPLHAGKIVGLEVAVCDDDGNTRDNIMTWTGTATSFWLVMDDYSKSTLLPRTKNLLDSKKTR